VQLKLYEGKNTFFLQSDGKPGCIIGGGVVKIVFACNAELTSAYGNKNLTYYFAGKDVFVFALSIVQENLRTILENPHVQTVFVIFQNFRLVRSPAEVCGEGFEFRP